MDDSGFITHKNKSEHMNIIDLYVHYHNNVPHDSGYNAYDRFMYAACKLANEHGLEMYFNGLQNLDVAEFRVIDKDLYFITKMGFKSYEKLSQDN